MKIISNSLVALGDSFTEWPNTYADYISDKLNIPLYKFAVGGVSNEFILSNFYHEVLENSLVFKDCFFIFQSTSMSRFEVDITKNTMGHHYLSLHNLWKDVAKHQNTVAIGDRLLLKRQFSQMVMKLPVQTPIDVACEFYSPHHAAIKICHQINVLAEKLSHEGNKFLFLLGLTIGEYEDITLDNLPLTVEKVSYNNLGMDQYVKDNDLCHEDGFHPSELGHQHIAENFVLKKFRELKWIND